MLKTFYERCLAINKEIPICREHDSCGSCISGMYQADRRDDYNCRKLVFEYTLNYMPAFVTEIYAFLTASRILESIKSNPICILSLGGGLGTDYLAISKYISDNHIEKKINYTMIDLTPEWEFVRNLYPHDNMAVHTASIFDCEIHPECFDIIFMNKLYTTLRQNGQEVQFWTWFSRVADSFDSKTAFIFHDSNSYYMGRDNFNNNAIRKFPNVTKYYTLGHNYSEYIQLPQLNIEQTTGIPNTYSFLPRMTESVFFVYRR